MFFNLQRTFITSTFLIQEVSVSLKLNLQATTFYNISHLGVIAVFRHGLKKTYFRSSQPFKQNHDI